MSMHRALLIQEILFDIFVYCCPPALDAYYRKRATPHLAVLARTCRAFKEPALDLLWRILDDLSPLARCLPEACHRSKEDMYSFGRPLRQSEWDTLQSYTHRIQSIRNFDNRLDWEFITTFLNPPSTEPLFPNLRVLHCCYTEKSMPVLHLPLPSLDFLCVAFDNPHFPQTSLFPSFCPNMTKLVIGVRVDAAVKFSRIGPGYISRWRNLCSVVCPKIVLDKDALVHLSHMPALMRLNFALSATFPFAASDSSLCFSNLLDMELHSESLPQISQFLFQTWLPVIKRFTAFIHNCPSRHDLTSFFARVPTSNTDHTIKKLRLDQMLPPLDHWPDPRSEDLILDFHSLQPCMKFNDLRHIELNVECNVHLTDSDILTLASAWPKLERLWINSDFGWNGRGGITPGGFIRFLKTCRSLCAIAIPIDTRGYTEFPQEHEEEFSKLTLPPAMYINLLDSIFEEESMVSLAAFLSGIAVCCELSLYAWIAGVMMGLPHVDENLRRWDKINGLVQDALRASYESGGSDVSFRSSDEGND